MNLTLIEPVQSILKKVEEVSGKGFEYIEKNDLIEFASVKIARQKMPKHLIFYKGTHADFINHTIAHECGHILRIFGAPENKRLMPVMNDKLKHYALKEMEEDIYKLSEELSFEHLTELVNMLYTGIIRQLTNFPPDIMIEKWIYNGYPELRAYQKESLKKQFSEAVIALSSDARKITPRKIYDASHLMNYAFFRILGLLIGVNLVQPYNNTDYIFKGKKLTAITEENYVDNYEGDIDMINRWANYLELTNWFDWTEFEKIPQNYLQSH
jgi:hypothetical protein